MNKKEKKQVFLYGFGNCPRRNADAAVIGKYFLKNGWNISRKIRKADLVIFNTCAFNRWREDLCIKKIRWIKIVKKKDTPLVICGCLPKINKERLALVFQGEVVGPRELDKLDKIIKAKKPIRTIVEPLVYDDLYCNFYGIIEKMFLQSPSLLDFLNSHLSLIKKSIINIFKSKKKGNISKIMDSINAMDKKIAKIRIATGCISYCSYCAIRFATGSLQSKNIFAIEKEFYKMIDKGYTKFMLIAEDVGAYGIDIGVNIADLLKRLLAVQADFKIILEDFNIRWFMKYFDQLEKIFKQHREKIKYICFPVESGSNKILQNMNRGSYAISEITKKLKEIKREIPKLNLHTHIMVGFPGETESGFKESLKFVKEVGFDYVDFFPYSDRPNTESSNLPNKVSRKIIKKRLFFARQKFSYPKFL